MKKKSIEHIIGSICVVRTVDILCNVKNVGAVRVPIANSALSLFVILQNILV